MAKEKTRGQKQILEENKATINFYLLMSGITFIFYLSSIMIIFSESFTTRYVVLSIFAAIVYAACLLTMKSMAKATYSETGSLLDAGIDLNMKDGFSEHLKDLIILTTLVLVLSLVHNYFWFIWFFAPGRALYLLWVNILGPWFFAPAPEADPEREDKKQRKLDRRMRRAQ